MLLQALSAIAIQWGMLNQTQLNILVGRSFIATSKALIRIKISKNHLSYRQIITASKIMRMLVKPAIMLLLVSQKQQ